MDIYAKLAALGAFEWDAGNRHKSWLKHDITPEEAEEVFINRPIFFSKDARHDYKEDRFLAMGSTHAGRLLHVTFTVRNERVRIISARPMNRRERSIFQHETQGA